MREIDVLIDKEKNKKIQVLGPVINRIKKDPNIIAELRESTGYLDLEYDNVSIGQRFYHEWFRDHNIKKCKHCGKNAKFSQYNRFSDKIGKKDSNYYTHCGSVRCLIEDFRDRGNNKQGYGALIAKISGNKDTQKELFLLTNFLDKSYPTISDSQRFYHIFFDMMDLELCEFCKEPRKYGFMNKFSEIIDKKDSNYCKTCGKNDCVTLSNIKYSKIGISNKYGVDNIWDIPGYREKMEKNNIDKWGTPYIMGSKHFKEKTKEKIEKEWGGNHPTKSKGVQSKKRKTNLIKYGFECSLQNPMVYDRHTKSCYTSKKYILPSGKIIYLQGYENMAMDILLKKYKEEDLIVSKKDIVDKTGIFSYIFLDKECLYYPDIYIESDNKIIEVKSEYTYNLSINQNELKKNSVINKNINFEFWIFDGNKNLRVI